MSKIEYIAEVKKVIDDFRDAIGNLNKRGNDVIDIEFEPVLVELKHIQEELGKIEEHSADDVIKNGEESVEQDIDIGNDILNAENILAGDTNIPLEIVDLKDEKLNAIVSKENASEDLFKEASGISEKNLPEEINIPVEDQNELQPTMENMAKIEHGSSYREPENKETLIIARNAMVGKKYELNLVELEGINLDGLENVLELEELNLDFDKQTLTIAGTPESDGEYACPIIYSDGDTDSNDKKYTLRILVNPDPRSLWKNLDPSPDELYPKAHFDYQQDSFSDFDIFAASQRGRSHAHAGTFRDDDFVLKLVNDNIYFIAVADGAGSAEYSREGSRIACDLAADSIQNHVEQSEENWLTLAENLNADRSDKIAKDKLIAAVYSGLSTAVMNARNGLISKAEEAEHELKEYSTTLLFSVIIKLKDSFFIASYSIGDGIIAHISDSVKLLSNPDGGQYAGQTRFLTMSEAIEDLAQRLKITFVDDLAGLYLMTDGISDPFFETDSNMSQMEYWEKLSSSINDEVDLSGEDSETQMKDWINFWSPGNHDDRTIVFVTKKSSK